MTAYVEECRREWKRLGVPDLLADEMATELESDLAEAEADGVSAAEMLGESDPRRFAATWAIERGLAKEQPPRKSRKRLWVWVAVGVVLLVFLVLFPALALIGTGSGSIKTGGGETVAISVHNGPLPGVKVPNLVGLKSCSAIYVAQRKNLDVQAPNGSCDRIVVSQKPAAGRVVRPPGPVRLRLRSP